MHSTTKCHALGRIKLQDIFSSSQSFLSSCLPSSHSPSLPYLVSVLNSALYSFSILSSFLLPEFYCVKIRMKLATVAFINKANHTLPSRRQVQGPIPYYHWGMFTKDHEQTKVVTIVINLVPQIKEHLT
jgi:hypothetical protein